MPPGYVFFFYLMAAIRIILREFSKNPRACMLNFKTLKTYIFKFLVNLFASNAEIGYVFFFFLVFNGCGSYNSPQILEKSDSLHTKL